MESSDETLFSFPICYIMNMLQNFMLYIDFDFTLYDTKRFADDLFCLIADKAHISVDTVGSDSRRYFSDPVLGDYDYEAHILSYDLIPKEMWQQLDIITRKTNYLYADSADFVNSLKRSNYQPSILSFGERKFQLAKITPTLKLLSLESSNVTVVNRRKGEHIAELHKGQSGALVDDVPDQQLPKGFIEIHLNRNATTPGATIKPGGYTVSSLKQAEDIIRSLHKNCSS